MSLSLNLSFENLLLSLQHKAKERNISVIGKVIGVCTTGGLLVHILRQINPVLTGTVHSVRLRYILVSFHPHLGLKWCFPFTFSDYIFIHISGLSL
jgi:hypothetical protein